MTLPYTLRLLCLCFASFFLIHGVLGLAVWSIAPSAVRMGGSMRPRNGARFLLILRLLPAALAALAVIGLCVPSYLWLETNGATERVGLACCAMALLGLFVCTNSLLRSARALWLSILHSKRCKREEQSETHAKSLPVTVMNGTAPVLALAGLFRPRVIVSRTVVETLSAEELEVALEHEHAHGKSRDNIKRLVLSLAPEILPFSQAFRRLDLCWARLIEWAADDEATAGDLCRSISLAAALVQVARLGAAPAASPLASFFVGDDKELSFRVERLLGSVPSIQTDARRWTGALAAFAAAAVALLGIAMMIRPATFFSVHRLLEELLR